jgi:hypothetical protein
MKEESGVGTIQIMMGSGRSKDPTGPAPDPQQSISLNQPTGKSRKYMYIRKSFTRLQKYFKNNENNISFSENNVFFMYNLPLQYYSFSDVFAFSYL